jgi:hypothetical protein
LRIGACRTETRHGFQPWRAPLLGHYLALRAEAGSATDLQRLACNKNRFLTRQIGNAVRDVLRLTAAFDALRGARISAYRRTQL